MQDEGKSEARDRGMVARGTRFRRARHQATASVSRAGRTNGPIPGVESHNCCHLGQTQLAKEGVKDKARELEVAR